MSRVGVMGYQDEQGLPWCKIEVPLRQCDIWDIFDFFDFFFYCFCWKTNGQNALTRYGLTRPANFQPTPYPTPPILISTIASKNNPKITINLHSPTPTTTPLPSYPLLADSTTPHGIIGPNILKYTIMQQESPNHIIRIFRQI